MTITRNIVDECTRCGAITDQIDAGASAACGEIVCESCGSKMIVEEPCLACGEPVARGKRCETCAYDQFLEQLRMTFDNLDQVAWRMLRAAAFEVGDAECAKEKALHEADGNGLREVQARLDMARHIFMALVKSTEKFNNLGQDIPTVACELLMVADIA